MCVCAHDDGNDATTIDDDGALQRINIQKCGVCVVWSSYIFYARAYLLCIICFICLGMCFFLSVPELKENILLNG